MYTLNKHMYDFEGSDDGYQFVTALQGRIQSALRVGRVNKVRPLESHAPDINEKPAYA